MDKEALVSKDGSSPRNTFESLANFRVTKIVGNERFPSGLSLQDRFSSGRERDACRLFAVLNAIFLEHSC